MISLETFMGVEQRMGPGTNARIGLVLWADNTQRPEGKDLPTMKGRFHEMTNHADDREIMANDQKNLDRGNRFKWSADQ